jgi:hypothetical protein
MAIWVPSLDIGGVLATPIYSTFFSGTCFGPSVQSRLDPFPTLFGPHPTLSIFLSLGVYHHDSAKLTTSNWNEVSMAILIAHTLRQGWLLSAQNYFWLLVEPPSVYARASGIRFDFWFISVIFLVALRHPYYRCIIGFNPCH